MTSNAKENRLIRLPEVQRLTGLKRSQLYALAQRDEFPRPIKLSERCSAWLESAVRDWICDRIDANRDPALLRASGALRLQTTDGDKPNVGSGELIGVAGLAARGNATKPRANEHPRSQSVRPSLGDMSRSNAARRNGRSEAR